MLFRIQAKIPFVISIPVAAYAVEFKDWLDVLHEINFCREPFGWLQSDSIGPFGSFFNPLFQDLKLPGWHRVGFGGILRRHDVVIIRRQSGKHIEKAVVGLAFHDDLVGLEGAFFVIQAKFAFGFVLAVATYAVEFEDRLDVAFKINGVLCRKRVLTEENGQNAQQKI